MIPPDCAAEVAQALTAWEHHRTRQGAAMPDGWQAVKQLVDICVRDAQDVPSRDQWLSLDDAADAAGVTVRTIRNWRLDGLESSKPGRLVRIRRGDLDDWIRNRP